MSRMQRKIIDDLLYSAGNQVVVREELDQYSDLFKLVTNHHEQYCELLAAENQQHEEGQFDDQDMSNFKHRVHSWLKEAAHKHQRVQDVAAEVRGQAVQGNQQAINLVAVPGHQLS